MFTQPAGAVKCGGAPQKICYLAEDYLGRRDVRDDIEVIFMACFAAALKRKHETSAEIDH
ncbi:hypothetical protein [Rhodopirellula bahusiensis]|uniref:hypothetical protein n=1 Tax=Rhodopirellula bahusiensis TaxID=2014065 RepID=UPI00326552C8